MRREDVVFSLAKHFPYVQEFLHRYVLVQAIEKAKSGHYVKKSRVRNQLMFVEHMLIFIHL